MEPIATALLAHNLRKDMGTRGYVNVCIKWGITGGKWILGWGNREIVIHTQDRSKEETANQRWGGCWVNVYFWMLQMLHHWNAVGFRPEDKDDHWNGGGSWSPLPF